MVSVLVPYSSIEKDKNNMAIVKKKRSLSTSLSLSASRRSTGMSALALQQLFLCIVLLSPGNHIGCFVFYVRAQQAINQSDCEYDPTTNSISSASLPVSERGSSKRTYEAICEPSFFLNDDISSSTVQQTNTGTTSATFFTIFCSILDKPSNSDIKNYIATGTNQHTIFAPPDTAFANIPGILGQLTLAQERMILAMHIIPGPPITTRDLTCDGFRRTFFNSQFGVSGVVTQQQQSTKTKCLTGGKTAQIGRGNLSRILPIIGTPNNVFNNNYFLFTQPTDFTNTINAFSGIAQDVVVCNGIVHVVSNVILPGGIPGGNNNNNNNNNGNNNNIPSNNKSNKGTKSVSFDPKKQKSQKSQIPAASISFYDYNPFLYVDNTYTVQQSTTSLFQQTYYGIGTSAIIHSAGKSGKWGKNGKNGKRRELAILDTQTKRDWESDYRDGNESEMQQEARMRRKQRLLQLL
mmetsp:Transcript_9295/g.18513  ORF Transcript_9295/g.18513 Transcript_9295/m.18513 type:complete len:463 (-) Transcript_9295:272-1660(-)